MAEQQWEMVFSDSEEAATAFKQLLLKILLQAQPQIDELRDVVLQVSYYYREHLGARCMDMDYADPTNRLAYLYMYLIFNSYVVYCSMRHPDLRKQIGAIRSSGTLKVCCVGGGPLPDLIGLTQYLHDEELWPGGGIDCRVFDRYPEWEKNWSVIRDNLPRQNLDVKYIKCNLVKDQQLEDRKFVQSADLVTLIRSVSVMGAYCPGNDKNLLLLSLLRDLKEGCFVLYVDRWKLNVELVIQAGLEVVGTYIGGVDVPVDCWFPTELGNYVRDLDHHPLLGRSENFELTVQLFKKAKYASAASQR